MGRIIIPYTPRGQFKPFHNRVERFAVGVAHRRAGKTVATINDKIKRAILTDKENYRAGYIAPFLKQSKEIAWEYLKRYARPVMDGPPNESELWVRLINGARIRLYGADNADGLRGGYLDDATLDEYGDMAPSVWGEVIRPMLADRKGTATFIGTPKGKNHFHEIYQRGLNDPEWFTFMLRASETGLIDDDELRLARADMTPEQYDQEFECSFEAAIMGAYFGKEMAQADREGRIRDTTPRGEVHTAWDLGHGSNMAIWAFEVGEDGPIVHDFIQIAGFYFLDYLKEVRRRGYNGVAYVPHDAKVPNFETGRTRIETMLSEAFRPQVVSDHSPDERINAAKLTLARTIFNGDKCASGLEALRQYRQEWDEKARVFKNVPKHDWASHPADSFGYLAMAWREFIAPVAPPPPPRFRGLNELTIEEYITAETGGPEKRDRV